MIGLEVFAHLAPADRQIVRTALREYAAKGGSMTPHAKRMLRDDGAVVSDGVEIIDPHHNGTVRWKWQDGTLYQRTESQSKWTECKRVHATPARIRVLAAALSEGCPKCYACEDHPAPGNNPCAVCNAVMGETPVYELVAWRDKCANGTWQYGPRMGEEWGDQADKWPKWVVESLYRKVAAL